MPPPTVDESSGAPEGFTPRVLPGPFFAGRTVYAGGACRDVFAARLTGEDGNGLGITHGGVIATLADIFLVGFIAAQLPAQARLVTASLAVDFLGPSRPGDWLLGRIHAHRIGRRQCVASGEFRVGERTVALIKANCAIVDPVPGPQS